MIGIQSSESQKPEALVVGIDGGQTSSKGVLSTLNGEVCAQASGGPILHLASRNSDRQFDESIEGLLHMLWEGAGIKPRPLKAIALGLTGVTRASPEAERAGELARNLVQAEIIPVSSDAFAALKGAHAGKPGVIVISGTGMVAMGIDVHARVGRCGGWGWVLGDEGSAFAIGRSGLRAALNAYDGSSAQTILMDLFLEYFQVARMPDIKRIYMASEFGARDFGRLAAVVSTAAGKGDKVALGIIEDNCASLARSVLTLVSKLDFGGQEVPVAPIGGAFEHIHGLRDGFERQILNQAQLLPVVSPRFPPEIGALIIALESCGADLDRAIVNITEHYPALRYL